MLVALNLLRTLSQNVVIITVSILFSLPTSVEASRLASAFSFQFSAIFSSASLFALYFVPAQGL